MLSNHLVLWHPLLLLPSIFPSIRVFSNELALCIRWTKYWSFRFSISFSSEYSGLISFRIGWFDLLAVQVTQKSFPAPQFESIDSLAFSLLYNPILTSVHDYWKTIALSIQTFVSKVMSLLFNNMQIGADWYWHVFFLIWSDCKFREFVVLLLSDREISSSRNLLFPSISNRKPLITELSISFAKVFMFCPLEKVVIMVLPTRDRFAVYIWINNSFD